MIQKFTPIYVESAHISSNSNHLSFLLFATYKLCPQLFTHRYTNRSLLSSLLALPYSVLYHVLSLSCCSRHDVHYAFHELCLRPCYEIVCGIRVNHFNYELTQQAKTQNEKTLSEHLVCACFAVNSFFLSFCFISLVTHYFDSNLVGVCICISICI